MEVITVLIISLVWILAGGVVYVLMLEDPEEAYELWRKHKLP